MKSSPPKLSMRLYPKRKYLTLCVPLIESLNKIDNRVSDILSPFPHLYHIITFCHSYSNPSSSHSAFCAFSSTAFPFSVSSGLPPLPVACWKNTGCHVSLFFSR